MDYHNYMYQAPPYPTHLHNDTAFSTQPHTHPDEGFHDPNMNNIDPTLQSVHTISSPAQLHSQWPPPQPLERFVKDPQKTALFNLGPPLQTMHHGHMMLPVAPLPPPSQRHGSPCSGHEPSSVCSSALSATGDSEFYHDAPSTPPDLPAMSPFATRAQLDTWSSHPHVYHFTGPGETHAMDVGVNPSEVNSLQDIHFGYLDGESSYEFSLQRGLSLQSMSSHYEMQLPGSSLPIDHIKRVSSPEEMRPPTRDEIRIPEASVYPDPVDDPSDVDEAGGLPFKRETDDDSDYKPVKRQSHKRITSTSSRKNNSKSAKRSNSRADERPPAKRPKVSASNSALPKMITSTSTKGNLSCPDCRQTNFKDETGLQNHIKKQHTRPFSCVFSFAGCDATFASKNEWKRHVSSQHLLLNYWLCQQDACEKTVNGLGAAASSRSRGNIVAPPLPNGAIFNRKDLYTQHIRRMHTPPNIKKATKQKKSGPAIATGSGTVSLNDWEDHLRNLQRDATRTRCVLPDHMTCPVSACGSEFRGQEAWDQRMEHVARHMEKASQGKEEKVVFGGPNDSTLMQWAARADVGVVKREGSSWVLNNPLKPGGKTANSGAGVESGDEDAEGEDE